MLKDKLDAKVRQQLEKMDESKKRDRILKDAQRIWKIVARKFLSNVRLHDTVIIGIEYDYCHEGGGFYIQFHYYDKKFVEAKYPKETIEVLKEYADKNGLVVRDTHKGVDFIYYPPK